MKERRDKKEERTHYKLHSREEASCLSSSCFFVVSSVVLLACCTQKRRHTHRSLPHLLRARSLLRCAGGLLIMVVRRLLGFPCKRLALSLFPHPLPPSLMPSLLRPHPFLSYIQSHPSSPPPPKHVNTHKKALPRYMHLRIDSLSLRLHSSFPPSSPFLIYICNLRKPHRLAPAD